MGRTDRKNTIALTIGALMLAAIVAVSVASNYDRAPPPEAETASPVEDGLPRGAVVTPQPTDWVGITGLLVSFGGVLLVAGTFYLQRIATIGELRAYIKIEIKSVTITPGGSLSMTISPHNYGKTPARKIAVCGNLFVRKNDWSWAAGGLPPPTWDEQSIDLHPDDQLEVTLFVKGESGDATIISKQLFDRIQGQESCVFARVAVRYMDGFRKQRETEMRWEMKGADAVVHHKGRVVMSRAT